MRVTSKHQLSRFRRIRGLIDLAADGDHVGAPVAELDGVIQRLKDHGEKQEQHRREMRAATMALCKQASHLRYDLMVPVELAARSLYPVGDEAGASIRRAVRPPSHRADYEQVVLAARGLASAVEPGSREFVQAGLPADFVTKLRNGATALKQAVNDRAAALQRRLAATQGIAVEVRRGVAVVRFLHSLVKPQLRADAPRAAEWKGAMLARKRSVGGGAVVVGAIATPALERPALPDEGQRPGGEAHPVVRVWSVRGATLRFGTSRCWIGRRLGGLRQAGPVGEVPGKPTRRRRGRLRSSTLQSKTDGVASTPHGQLLMGGGLGWTFPLKVRH